MANINIYKRHFVDFFNFHQETTCVHERNKHWETNKSLSVDEILQIRLKISTTPNDELGCIIDAIAWRPASAHRWTSELTTLACPTTVMFIACENISNWQTLSVDWGRQSCASLQVIRTANIDHLTAQYNAVITDILDETALSKTVALRKPSKRPSCEDDCRRYRKSARRLEWKLNVDRLASKMARCVYGTPENSLNPNRQRTRSTWRRKSTQHDRNARRVWRTVDNILGRPRLVFRLLMSLVYQV